MRKITARILVSGKTARGSGLAEGARVSYRCPFYDETYAAVVAIDGASPDGLATVEDPANGFSFESALLRVAIPHGVPAGIAETVETVPYFTLATLEVAAI